jgi:branched-subunit amino acid aminotransferase/4-amino-4-deoxychorismate lyase
LLRREAVDEVLWRGVDGCYTEGSRSNLFAVLGERVLTPPVDGRILAGVTRGALIEAGRSVGLEVFESAVHPAMSIDELYATSTLKELAPVVLLDGVDGPGGGPVGRRLHSAFRALVARESTA